MTTPESIDRYRITGVIGRGGMATVYLAHDPRFQRDVAIKVLSAELLQEADFRARFDREARLVADLEHPNIVPVYDYGEEEGRPYLVMRMMRGRSLRERLRDGPLPPDDICRLLTPLSDALDLAHRRGVVHRDIKAGNVLLDEEGRPYLADFGIARMVAETGPATDIGTIQIMSPEQVTGGALDAASDIYQFGILLFELLTGRKPYRAETRRDYMALHVSGPVPAVTEVNPALPVAYDTVVQKAMAKNPAERYETAGELAADFCAAVERANGGANGGAQRDNRWLYAAGLLLIFLLAFVIVQRWLTDGGLPPVLGGDTPTETATQSPTAGVPTNTPAATAMPLSSAPPAGAQLGSRWQRPADNMTMVFVPGGAILLGSSEAEIAALLAECKTASGSARCSEEQLVTALPAHPVSLSPFWIDSYEVNNSQYRQCVAAGFCAAPQASGAETAVGDYAGAAFADYPVVHVNWSEAQSYCRWAGGDLPTEAQWEYAARGPERRAYPWGDLLQDNLANFCDHNCPFAWREPKYDDGQAELAPVGHYGANDSWAGAYDLAGNVWEWVADRYAPYQAGDQAQTDPLVSEGGEQRVIRGGSWAANSWFLWSAVRSSSAPTSRNGNLGFRCARPQPDS